MHLDSQLLYGFGARQRYLFINIFLGWHGGNIYLSAQSRIFFIQNYLVPPESRCPGCLQSRRPAAGNQHLLSFGSARRGIVGFLAQRQVLNAGNRRPEPYSKTLDAAFIAGNTFNDIILPALSYFIRPLGVGKRLPSDSNQVSLA